MGEDVLLSVLTVTLSAAVVYTVAKYWPPLSRRRARKAPPACQAHRAATRAVITAESLVADTYRLIGDLYDTPTIRTGHP